MNRKPVPNVRSAESTDQSSIQPLDAAEFDSANHIEIAPARGGVLGCRASMRLRRNSILREWSIFRAQGKLGIARGETDLSSFGPRSHRQHIESRRVKELNQSDRHSYDCWSVPPVGNWASKEHAVEHSHGLILAAVDVTAARKQLAVKCGKRAHGALCQMVFRR